MAKKTATPAASDGTLAITRILDVPRDFVFQAWTDPERARQWWGPRNFTATSVELASRPGGTWRASMRSPEGKDYVQFGILREIVPPERLVYTLTWAEDPSNEMRVTVTFTERNGKTELAFRQDGFKSLESRNSHEQGWNECFDRLAEYVVKERHPVGAER